MNAVRVIEAKHPASVSPEQMGQQEREVVSNDAADIVDPDLLAQDTDPTRAAKTGFVVGFLARWRFPPTRRVYYR